MKTIDKLVRLVLGWIGATLDIPTLIVKYVLGLIWTVYMLIRGKNFKVVFSKLNAGTIDNIKWLKDEFKFYT